MTLSKERTLRLQAEGYWAVEIRLSDSHAARPQYLCHAANDMDAQRIAGDLMGPTSAVHGFAYYRLELPIQNRTTASLPAMGASEKVQAGAWPSLMLAHAASEAKLEKNLSRAG